MNQDAPLAHLQHHRPAVAAVMRDKTGIPNASDRELHAARDAGLIRFENSTGHGVWRMTPLGADLMTDY
ncbi:hypothetical protein [Rhodobacter capsulatus]|jgi:hypothetical protein|uniref:Uncharacterized protein n=1 Tax=Rhodobacter phage RcapNL TaxID=1131316 RepID=H6WBP4_9CAUD|nr:hypothetical protein [Rhodobacter capsulatus]YP_007518423.1 hypothetical protein I920_gp41 [Rhodobacter phage RcapNL]AFA44881.1 hypothetical protein RcapNL_00041 [Rhodobacter phage RcapNL]AFK66545.1 hypothetical protein RHZG_00039 [Rhodobacter phage RcNL1]MDS0926149.1 hypothetical protein [Rhodobacter capsulatus]